MVITGIEKVGKYKYKVFIDMEYAFFMSWKELYYWNIKENEMLSEGQYQSIMEDVILKKCKRKALTLLKDKSRTEHELRQKLYTNLYTQEIIDQTVEYIHFYHYLDDERYVENFIDSNKKRHSKKWIENKLQQKGIKKEQYEGYFQREYSEEEAIIKAIERKLKGKKIWDHTEKNKIFSYLYRQGFSMCSIQKYVKLYESDVCETVT